MLSKMVGRLCGETTSRQRTIVSYRAMVMNLVCGFVSAVCLGFSFYGTIRLSEYVETVARAPAAGSLMHGLTGLTVASFVVSMLGIYVCFTLYGRYGEYRGGRLRPFALAYLTCAGCVALTVAAAFMVVSSLILPHIAQTRNMLSASVHKYGSGDASLRSLIDEMHGKLHCCGADGYGDWSRIFWVRNASVTSRKELAVPKSCCDQATYSRCVTKVPGDLPEVLTIHKRGCNSVLKQHLRFNLTVQAALVLAITVLHCIVVLYLFAMLFSRDKQHDDVDAARRRLPMPTTQIVPPSRRSSAATGQKKITAASAAITENWDPRATKTAKPSIKPASRAASQVASEPAVGVRGLKTGKSSARKTSSVRQATSVPAQKSVYANLPPPAVSKPDDTYLVPVYADKPSAPAEGDYLVPVTDRPKPTDNVYESLVPTVRTATRPAVENIYESLGPPAPAKVRGPAAPHRIPGPVTPKQALTENRYEPLRSSASNTRSKARFAYEPLHLQKQPSTPALPPPLPPRPSPAVPAKASLTRVPAGPSQLRAHEPPLPHQSTIAIAGSVWPAKLNDVPSPPPSRLPSPPAAAVSAQPSAKFRKDLNFREDLKSVVKRAMEAQRRQAGLATNNTLAPPPTPAAVVTLGAVPSSDAAELASRPALRKRVPGRKVVEALKMIEKNRTIDDVPAQPSTTPVTGPTTASIPPPPPPPPLPPFLLKPAQTNKYQAAMPPSTQRAGAAITPAPTQPAQLSSSFKKKSPAPPPPTQAFKVPASAMKRPAPVPPAPRIPTPVPSQQPIYETVSASRPPRRVGRSAVAVPPPLPPPRAHRRSPQSPGGQRAKSPARNQASSGIRRLQDAAENSRVVRTLKKLISVERNEPLSSSSNKSRSPSPQPHHHRHHHRHHRHK